MMLNINGRLSGFRSAVLANIEHPETVAVLAEVALGRGEFGRGRLGLLGHGIVKLATGPVVYGQGRRNRRKLRAIRRRVGVQRDGQRATAAALRARRHGVLSERLQVGHLSHGGPFCWCGRGSTWNGSCRVHGGNPAFEYAS